MPAVQKALIHLSQFTCDMAGLPSLSWTATRKSERSTKIVPPQTDTERNVLHQTPHQRLREPYSEQQGAPEAVQGQVAKEILQHCRLQGKPQLLLQLDIKLSSSNDKCLFLFTTLNFILRVDSIQRQKSKQILKNKQTHIISFWWNSWKTMPEIQYSIFTNKTSTVPGKHTTHEV